MKLLKMNKAILILINLVMMGCQSNRSTSDESEIISFVLKCASFPYCNKAQSNPAQVLSPELCDMTINRRPSTHDICEHLDDFNWFMATQEAELETSRLEEFKRLDSTTFQVIVGTYYNQSFRQRIHYIVKTRNGNFHIMDIIYDNGRKLSDLCVEAGAQRKVLTFVQ